MYTMNKFKLQIMLSTNLIWHDILFGNYDDAKNKLVSYKSQSEKINRPNKMHNFYVLNALTDLNLGDPESSIQNFNMTNENNGFPGIPLGSDYYTYFKALALKANGKVEESNALFKEIATNNFWISTCTGKKLSYSTIIKPLE